MMSNPTRYFAVDHGPISSHITEARGVRDGRMVSLTYARLATIISLPHRDEACASWL